MIKNKIIRKAEKTRRRENPFPRIRSASSFFPLPSAMAESGAPPAPTNALKADMITIMGSASPTPVRAVAPTSGI